MRTRKTWLFVLGAVVAFVSAVGGAAVALGNDTGPVASESTVAPAVAAAATNAAGQTYGALPDGPDDTVPDLVRVVATNGKTGYCRDKDTLGPCPDDDAEANTKACLRGYVIPVYESDGTTQIGEFVVGGLGSEAVYGEADGSKITMTARADGTIVTTKTADDGTVLSQTLEALDGKVTTVK